LYILDVASDRSQARREAGDAEDQPGHGRRLVDRRHQREESDEEEGEDFPVSEDKAQNTDESLQWMCPFSRVGIHSLSHNM
jgi:hypothetical protein